MSDTPVELTEPRVLEILQHGRLVEKGLLPYSSNHSFMVVATHGELSLPAVYKPQRGENPLWDFEWGTLCKRERAAYVISSALGWGLVPPTVLREGTRGLGSVQFYVHHNAETHYFTIQDDARFAPTLRQLALFDFIINNADRKSGHCLIGDDLRLWAIDHGISFHTEYKLRTVIWEFSDEPIEQELVEAMTALRCQLSDADHEVAQQMALLLADDERKALHSRLNFLLRKQIYPPPHPQRRNYPWPPV